MEAFIPEVTLMFSASDEFHNLDPNSSNPDFGGDESKSKTFLKKQRRKEERRKHRKEKRKKRKLEQKEQKRILEEEEEGNFKEENDS